MPWKEMKKITMREEFVKRVLSHEKSKSELCREYGISRPTGDKWIKRYLSGEKLDDRNKAPVNIPGKTDIEIEKKIVSYRNDFKALGAVKIRQMMQNEGIADLPSAKTFNNILKRNGLITKEASLAATPYIRFEKSEPNEMWQSDFKGHFAMKNGVRCHPLNIIDDFSRFNVCCDPLLSETYLETRKSVEGAFNEYGLPFSFLCDNGNPWGTPQSTGYSRFEVWLMELGVLTIHGRARHPQTQGKEERFNGSFTRECLRLNEFSDQEDARRKFAEYRNFYNNVRPHHALGLDVPNSKYRKSPRKYPSRIESWEYSDVEEIHTIKETGYFSYRGQGYFLSEAFGGKRVAMREADEGHGLINLYFRQFIIGQINIEKRVFTFKRSYLIHGDPRLQNNEK